MCTRGRRDSLRRNIPACVVPNSAPWQIMYPLVLVGLEVGVGQGLGLGVELGLGNEGVHNLAWVQNSAQHRQLSISFINIQFESLFTLVVLNGNANWLISLQ